MMIIVAAVVMGATFLAVRSFNAASMKADRYRVTQAALDEAKAALIAYAVADPNRPGSLPCPDIDNDGRLTLNVDYVGSNCTALIGRLPWYTLGLPDLRDGSGERLWYAVSSDFQANNTTVALNSDTAFRTGNTSLTVAGNQPASNIAAIVIAPGGSLRRADNVAQSRACPGAGCNVASNFLDILGTDNADANTTFISSNESDTFNDRLLPVYSDDIMPLVERRAGREYAQKLREHFDKWQAASIVVNTKGFYPWAAPFSNPAIDSPGVNNTSSGSLPMSAASVVWTSATSTLGSCSGVGTNEIQCGGFVLCLFSACLLNINARVGNIATAFVDPPTNASVVVTGLTLGSAVSTWTMVPAAQALDFNFSSGSFLGIAILTVRVTAPEASSWTTTSSWLTTNNWNRLTYYALSPRYGISGAGNCAVSAQCLSITNGTTTAVDRQALIITTGRALPALSPTPQVVPRPAGVASLANYLEGENLVLDNLYRQSMRSSQFNDQPVVVRP